MRKMGQKILTVGIVMLTSGLILPWLVGTLIPPFGYSVLQIGGLILIGVGWLVRTLARA